MKKINIVIDGNYLMHSELGIFSGYKPNTFVTEKDEIEFLQGVANKFFFALSQLPKGGNIVFTIDSSSWRKAIEIENGGYKSKRHKEDGTRGIMDEETMKKFFNLMSEFGRCLTQVGIIVSRIGGAEGDDLIYRWVEKFYNMGENCIIMSGDRDITQVVRTDGEKWVIQWNNKKNSLKFRNMIFVPEGWTENWLQDDVQNEVSIFNFSISTEKETLRKIIRDQNITLETVYPDEVVFNKILAGDDGDDVPPVWIANVPNKKGKMMEVRMTGKKPGVLIEHVSQKYNLNKRNIMSMWENEDFMQDCAGLVLRLTKDVDGSTERYVVIEAMRRNATLVWLNETVLPYNLIAEMDLHIDTMLRTNETQRQKWNRKGLFENTRFDDDVIPDKHDPFIGMVIPE